MQIFSHCAINNFTKYQPKMGNVWISTFFGKERRNLPATPKKKNYFTKSIVLTKDEKSEFKKFNLSPMSLAELISGRESNEWGSGGKCSVYSRSFNAVVALAGFPVKIKIYFLKLIRHIPCFFD